LGTWKPSHAFKFQEDTLIARPKDRPTVVPILQTFTGAGLRNYALSKMCENGRFLYAGVQIEALPPSPFLILNLEEKSLMEKFF
jgi:hypothetical protein